MKTKQLTKDMHWVGALDPDLRVFDIIMYTEFGTTYNSYLLKGSEKTVLFETAKVKFFEDYLAKIKELVPIEEIDYIILDHTEPDHAGSVEKLLKLNPKIKLVGSAAAIGFIKEICNREFNSIVVKDGDTLSLGNKTLKFITAPNLHWPDTIYTYIPEEKTLVTCDSFGAHYSLEEVTNDKITNHADYQKALRYYYDMIIGPFKSFALEAIKKIDSLEIDMICTGHGPVLVENPRKIVDLYKEWSTEKNPNTKKKVVMPYVSAYGYTKLIGDQLAAGIKAAGDIDVVQYDLVTDDMDQLMADLYWADGILVGTPTIVGEALKPIWDMTTSIFAKTHGGKIAAAFGSYGWSGEGVPHMMQRLRQLNMKLYGEGLRIKFKPNDAQNQEAYEYGYGFGKSVLAGKILEDEKPPQGTKVWKCVVCGEMIIGEQAPSVCPVCGVGPDQFVAIEQDEVKFHSQEKKTFVIVGSGVAGTTAAEEIRKRNPVAEIELISEEPIIGYNRPMLTKGLLSELDMLHFFIKPYQWYQENNIRITLNTKVVEIQPEKKKVILSDGQSRAFDKLILATGARSFLPPVKGSDASNVFTIRTVNDVHKIQEYLPKVKRAVVIGGGILGLEAAWELHEAGKQVAIVEAAPLLMVRQLDEKAAKILADITTRNGLEVFNNISMEDIIKRDGMATGVRLKDGTLLETDLVIFSTGVRPNIDLAADHKFSLGRAYIVNEKMETGIKDIYACGDCAEFNGVNYSVWPEAQAMGKVAGANAVGDDLVYENVIPSNAFTGMNTHLFSIGDVGKNPDLKYKVLEVHDQAKETLEKMYFVNNRFCGGILVGDVKKTARFIEAYKNHDPITKMMQI